MRALLIGLLTVAGIAIVMPISVSPVSAQGVFIETPIGGVSVMPPSEVVAVAWNPVESWNALASERIAFRLT